MAKKKKRKAKPQTNRLGIQGRSIEDVLKSNKSFFIFLLACAAIVSLLAVMPRFFTMPTGKAIFSISDIQPTSESVIGQATIALKSGELIPADAIVKARLNEQEKSILLSSLIEGEKSTGNFYIENAGLEGSGEGFGVAGEKKTYPTIYFRLRIDKTTPDSKQPAYSVTGSAIETRFIDGQVSALKEFAYNLGEGETASIEAESVHTENNALTDDTLALAVENNAAVVSTNYYEIEEGFGKEYSGEATLSLNIDVSKFGLFPEEGDLQIEILYNDVEIVSGEKEVAIAEAEASSQESSENITEELNQTKAIPDITIQANTNYTFSLAEYFTGAENYTVREIENIQATIDGNLITFAPDSGFIGGRNASVTAYSKAESIESNSFNVDVVKSKITFSVKAVPGNMTECPANLSMPGLYTLNKSLTATDTCFTAEADNITLDCRGFNITGDDVGFGVYSSGYKNFTIKNCKIYNFLHGIKLENTENSTIVNNTLKENNLYGAYILSSSSNNLTNNIVSNNYQHGLSFSLNSDYNVLVNNTVETNSQDGIYIISSDNNILTSNKASNNSRDGVYLNSGSGNTLASNNVSYNNNYGIGLYSSSDNNILSRNNLSGNYDGIHIESDSNNNSLIYNSIINSTRYSMYINASSNNITQNSLKGKISSGYIGIFLYSGAGNNILDKNTLYDYGFGIYLKSSFGNNLTGNQINNSNIISGQTGIYLHQSFNNNLAENKVNESYYGIFLNLSWGNNLTGNKVYDNAKNGIFLKESFDNTLSRNNVSGRYYVGNGILLDLSSNNSLAKNNVKNQQGGIYIINSSNNSLSENEVSINTAGGLMLESSSNNILIGNNASNNEVGASGISLSQSSNNNLTGNNINSNGANGISIYNSLNNDLIGNNASYNNEGIYLYNSSNHRLNDNRIDRNNRGIYIYQGLNNNLTSNNASYNTLGVFLYTSLNNNLYNNDANNNSEGGILIWASSNNSILTNNILNKNGEYGIQIDTGSNNTLLENNITNSNTIGIYLSYSNKNNLTGNNVNHNKQSGIYFYSSSNNSLILNTLYNNSQNGIYVTYLSSNNVLMSNNASKNNLSGIYLDWGSNNLISNIVNENLDYGIYTYAFGGNRFIENEANNNQKSGIFIYLSSNNNLSRNRVGNNSNHGVYINYSSNNALSENNITNNNRYGIYVQESSGNNLTQNNINNNTLYEIYLQTSINNRLSGNIIIGNRENNKSNYGIYLFSNSNNNTLILNSISDSNHSGVCLNLSFNNTLASNTITNNKRYGLLLVINSSGNTVYNNFFNNTNNTWDNSTIGNMWNVTYNCTGARNILGARCMGGNYWSDYTGEDNGLGSVGGIPNIEGDGIGDTNVPYNSSSRIPGGKGDWLPLMHVPNEPPGTPSVILNSSLGKNMTDEDLLCWARAIDSHDMDRLDYSGYWYKNGEQQINVLSRIIGGASVDYGFGVAADNEQDIIIVGFTNSFGEGQRDVWTIKYNSSGSQVWNKTIGGVNNESASDVAMDGSDNIIVTGYTESFGEGLKDIWTIKYDSSGSQIWNKTSGGLYDDEGFDIAVDKNDSVVVGGYTKSFGDTDGDFWILKYSLNDGYTLWNKKFGGSNIDYATGVAVDSWNDIIVVGYTYSFGAGNSDFLIVKYDENGGYLWNKTLGTTGPEFAQDVAVDSENSIIVAGHNGSAGENDVLVVKYNLSGANKWNASFDSGANDYGFGVDVDSEDNIITAGYTNITGNNGLLLLKFNSSGSLVWNKTFSSENESAEGYDVHVDSLDNIIVAGNYSQGNGSVLLMKYYGFGLVNQTESEWVNVAVLSNNETEIDENWSCRVKAYDKTASSSYQMSGSITIKQILSISFISPENITYLYNNILVNITNSSNVQAIWWNNGSLDQDNITYTEPVSYYFSEGSHTIYAWGNNSEGAVEEASVTFSVDVSTPYVEFISPQNITYITPKILIDIIKNSGTENVWWNNGSLDQDNITYTEPVYYNFSEGSHTIYAWGNNTFGEVTSANVTFFIDSIMPEINFTEPTIEAGASPQSAIWANVTANDTNLATIKIYLYNSTELLNSTDSSIGELSLFVNFTSLADGIYYLNASANDTAGNTNWTETREIVLNAYYPLLTIISPANNSWQNGLRFNVSINKLGICWATFNDTNITLLNVSSTWTSFYYFNASGVNETSQNNTYNVTFYCNDSFNRINSSMRFFGVDKTSPNISLLSPAAGYSTTSALIEFSFNVTDNQSVSSCRLIIDGSIAETKTSINKSMANTINHTLSSAGSHTWRINCTDEAGNEGNSSSRSLTITAPVTPSEPSGGGGGEAGAAGYWTTTYFVNNSKFEAGYTTLVRLKERLGVTVNSAYHYVGIVALTSTTATINVTSMTQQATFSVGQERRFEVTNDSYYDILVRLNKIATVAGNLSANITVKKIHESITGAVITPPPTEQPEQPPAEGIPTEAEEKKEEKKPNLFLVLLIILAIFAVLGIAGFIVWREIIKKQPAGEEEEEEMPPAQPPASPADYPPPSPEPVTQPTPATQPAQQQDNEQDTKTQ
jgi:uncharacterized delta-60 repeat protein